MFWSGENEVDKSASDRTSVPLRCGFSGVVMPDQTVEMTGYVTVEGASSRCGTPRRLRVVGLQCRNARDEPDQLGAAAEEALSVSLDLIPRAAAELG